MKRNEYLRNRASGRDGYRGRHVEPRFEEHRPYRREYDYGYDYDESRYRREEPRHRYEERSSKYEYDDLDKEYKSDLKEWIEKLKHKDKFRLSTPDIIHKAKSMGVRFEDYDEVEFEAVYYMLISDFTNISNDPHTYLAMAKSFLEDDDIEVSPSEKVCIYFYKIVKGE